jgi:hypothetical protein
MTVDRRISRLERALGSRGLGCPACRGRSVFVVHKPFEPALGRYATHPAPDPPESFCERCGRDCRDIMTVRYDDRAPQEHR